jgi:hypothetical protein
MNRTLTCLIAACAALAFVVGSATQDAATGAIAGTVRDASGARNPARFMVW